MVFTDLLLDQSSSSLEGGGLYIENGANFKFNTSTFTNMSAKRYGSILYSSGPTVIITIINSKGYCKAANLDYSTHLTGKIDLAEPTFDNAGAFYISSALSVTSNSNLIRNCYLAEQGGAYTLINTVFTDTNSEYYNNAALQGGVLYIERSSVSLTDITISDAYAVSGGVFYVYRSCPFTVSNITISDTYAYENGGVAYHA